MGFFGNYGANGLYFSVLCAEHEPLVDADKNIPYILPSMAEWENTSQEDNREECAIWNVKHSLLSLEEMPISDIPALLLSGHFDPVTPPEYGEQALESFPNGKHVIDPIGAHGIAFSDECTISIVESFLLDPSHTSPRIGLGFLYQTQGKYKEAIEQYKIAVYLDSESLVQRVSLAACYRLLGQEDNYLKHIDIASSYLGNGSIYVQACFYSVSGNIDKAITLLKFALENNNQIIDLIRTDPNLEFIRDNPQYKNLIQLE